MRPKNKFLETTHGFCKLCSKNCVRSKLSRHLKICKYCAKQIWKSFDFIHFHYSWKFIFWDFRSFSRNKSYLGIFGDPHPIPGKSIPIPKNPHPRGFFPKVTHPQSPSPSPGFGDGDQGSPKIPIPAATLSGVSVFSFLAFSNAGRIFRARFKNS